ncbi:MAG: (deoxy)nucleoside triphosphate pyrophosphohydrolase [Bacteroidales bacterium]
MTEVTCAIVVHRGLILVTQRGEQMAHPLKWEFPGGKVKEGESPEYCIRREILEELGLRVTARQLLPSVVHRYDTGEVRLIPFVCILDGGNLSLREHRAFRWVAPGDLDKLDWLEADVEVVRSLKERGIHVS